MHAVAVEVAKLALKAGETLVVNVPGRINAEQRDAIEAALKPVLPNGARVLVLDSGISLSVLAAE